MLSQLVQLAGRLAVAAATVTAPIQPTAATIPFRIVAQGSDSRIAAHRELIIRAPGVWDFVTQACGISAAGHRLQTRNHRRHLRRPSGPGSGRVACDRHHRGGWLDCRAIPAGADRSRSEPSEAQRPFVIVAIPPQRAPMKFIMAHEATD